MGIVESTRLVLVSPGFRANHDGRISLATVDGGLVRLAPTTTVNRVVVKVLWPMHHTWD